MPPAAMAVNCSCHLECSGCASCTMQFIMLAAWQLRLAELCLRLGAGGPRAHPGGAGRGAQCVEGLTWRRERYICALHLHRLHTGLDCCLPCAIAVLQRTIEQHRGTAGTAFWQGSTCRVPRGGPC